ncbi:Type 1 glutamine amidotransferase-like domain-containing protein [Anaerolentibacter hominis]|uniref:Type 1 glutamine amidotransferase-like domain-containing protein n=1 Tax=Anaerolentibacter hominis TaxID=3079009 RepID=UPI0031B85728
MLLLTSDGLSSPELKEEACKFLSGAGSAVMITTAAAARKEKDWSVPRLTEELYSLGLSVTYMDIELEDPSCLNQYDVIELIGGNPYFLLHQLRRKNLKPVFHTLEKTKLIIGVSAGSLVLQEQFDLIGEYTPGLNRLTGLSDTAGMGLTDLEILPHYHRFLSRFDHFEERARDYEQRRHKYVVRLSDGDGIVLHQGSVRLIRAQTQKRQETYKR